MADDKEQKASPRRSPSPRTAKTDGDMDFFDALRRVKDGALVTRRAWEDENVYVSMVGKDLMIKLADGKHYYLIVTDGDMDGEDWRVIVAHQS